MLLSIYKFAPELLITPVKMFQIPWALFGNQVRRLPIVAGWTSFHLFDRSGDSVFLFFKSKSP